MLCDKLPNGPGNLLARFHMRRFEESGEIPMYDAVSDVVKKRGIDSKHWCRRSLDCRHEGSRR
jgi:hypothetical protein